MVELLVTVVVILLDWQTKQWASTSLDLYRPLAVFPGFNLTLAHNYGAAFSFLSDAGGWQRWFLTVLAAGVSLVMLIWIFRLSRSEWLTALALSLVLGGAIGNLIDRVQLGYVVDFIDVYFGEWHYPAFNIADSAITVGVILLLMEALMTTVGKHKAA
ncbi:MAG: signal peptidase II [Xanthomonadales bacterium]|nr:signal peptidase II [Xanthomonadales bacterium]